MKKLLLLACAATASFVGCCGDSCCKSCGKPTTGQAQNMGQVPASPSTTALAGRTLQSGQPTSSQVLGAQQTAPQSSGLMTPNAMSSKPATMDTMSR
jgi:hypothetical protein